MIYINQLEEYSADQVSHELHEEESSWSPIFSADTIMFD